MTFTRIAAFIFVAFFFFNLVSCSTPSEKKEKHFQKAQEYLKVDNDKAAIIELKNAIQLDAKYADARYQLGLLYLKTGNPKGAFDELQRAASLDPNNLDAGVKVAEFYLLSRQKEESRNFVDKVLATDPNYLDGLALLANLELIEGNFANAEEAINKAIVQAPENDKFYNIKGRIYIAQNKWQESEELFLKAITLAPDNFTNYQAMLMLYEQRNDEVAIQKLLDTMVAKFPDNSQLHLMLANIYEQKHELDKAENEMLKMVEIQNDSIPSRLMLSNFYVRYRFFDKAETTLKSALTKYPDDLQLLIALAELSFDLQKFAQAQSIMEKVLATNPDNGGANLIKARFLIREGKNNEAIQVITPLMMDYPKWAEPFYYHALLQLRLGKTELAQKSIESALKNDTTNDLFHTLAAQINLLRGNSNEAEREARLALRINGQNGIAVKILAKSFIQAKKHDEAVAFIENLDQQAVAQDAEMLSTLGTAYLGQNNEEQARQTFSDLLELAPDNSNALAFFTALSYGGDIPQAIGFVKAQIAKSDTAGHYLLLGDLLARNNQQEEALLAYQKAQELAPENPRGYILRARLLSQMGRIDETIAQYEELLKTDPDSIAGIMGLATSYEVQGETAKAKEHYVKALGLQPDLPAAANNLAWLLASEDGADLGEALRLAMQAKQALPDQPHVTDTLGWVHYKRNSYSLAITQFRQALQERPDDPVIQYHLALALHSNGEKKEAIEYLEKSLASESEFPDKKEAAVLLIQWQNE